MKKTETSTLSISTTAGDHRPTRLSTQNLHTLRFIHRFHHVTSKHIQASLGHASSASSRKQLYHLINKGYLARHYSSSDRSANRYASYYLTPAGLAVLKSRQSSAAVRVSRSARSDAIMSAGLRARYHVLADVYCYFKRHFNGQFEFFTATDLAGFDYFPDRLPDGYIRFKRPDGSTRHYFVEIFGRHRSTFEQTRRLESYRSFSNSKQWQAATGSTMPSLLLVTGSRSTQRRMQYILRAQEDDWLSTDFCIFITTEQQLETEQPSIWQKVFHHKAQADVDLSSSPDGYAT